MYIKESDEKLQVFDRNDVYLPTKKIGKNNPKAEQIIADNAVRQEWNRTADVALVSGVEKEKILQIKQAEINDKTRWSLQKNGWLPDIFRTIIKAAIQILKQLILVAELPPKPVLKVNMAEYKIMEITFDDLQPFAREIRTLQNVTLPQLNKQLEDCKGIFKGKERKAIAHEIQRAEKKIIDKTDDMVKLIKSRGYPDIRSFMDTYNKAQNAIVMYNLELAEWERIKKNTTSKNKDFTAHKPPSRATVKQQLKQFQKEGQFDRKKQIKFIQLGLM